jgi:hypothetical protein
MPDAPKRDLVVFAGDGFDQIRESDRANALVVSRIVKQPAEFRRRSPGAIGIQTPSSLGESRSAAIEIGHPSRCCLPPPLNQLPWDIAQDEFGVKGADFIGIFGTVLLLAAQD